MSLSIRISGAPSPVSKVTASPDGITLSIDGIRGWVVVSLSVDDLYRMLAETQDAAELSQQAGPTEAELLEQVAEVIGPRPTTAVPTLQTAGR